MFIIQPVSDIISLLVSNNVAADSAAEYDATKTYVTGDVCKVTTASTVYKCIADSTTKDGGITTVPVVGIYPPDYLTSNNALYPWMELRAVNATAAFDQYINTQSVSDSGVDYLQYVIKSGGCDSVALFNVTAKSITVDVYDNAGSLVSTETQQTCVPVYTLDDYFFSEVVYKENIAFGFAIGIGGTIRITIRNDNSQAKCGMIVLGRKLLIGKTKTDIELPITDYSKYDTDTLGRVKMSQGNYARLAKFTLYVDEDYSGRPFWSTKSILEGCRGKRVVYCLDNGDYTWNDNPDLMFCGYYTDFNPIHSNVMSTIEMTVNGVV